jgi:hypothetical protein
LVIKSFKELYVTNKTLTVLASNDLVRTKESTVLMGAPSGQDFSFAPKDDSENNYSP